MKQTVLGMSPTAYQKILRRRTLLCLAVAGLALGLNILFTILRTDTNHTLMLILNILSDILAGCFLVTFISLRILPQRRLFRLFAKDKTVFEMTVESICDQPRRYMDMDCVTVNGSGRTCFLPVGTLILREQERYTLSLVSNIILEVHQ